jgi:hypothetical protein
MINLTKRTCTKIADYVNSLSYVPGNFGTELTAYKEAKLLARSKAEKNLRSAITAALEGEKNLIFKEFITRRIYELVRYNNEIYIPCTALIETLSAVLEGVTGVETKTMRVSSKESETFSWDFSKVDYTEVNKKTADMFRKIVVSDGTVRDIPFEDLYLLEGTKKGKKLFNYHKDSHGGMEINVISESNRIYHNVSKIRDEIVIGGRPQEGIDFDAIAQEMLDAIVTIIKNKGRQDPGKQKDILGVLFSHIKEVCEKIVNTAFEALLLSSAKGHDFSENLAPEPGAPGDKDISPESKRRIYERALDDFYFHSGLSLPFRDSFMPDLADVNYTSETISPEFTDPDFIEIYNNKNATTRAGTCTIRRSPLLINLRLFLNLRLTDYHYLPEYSEAKKKLEESDFALYAQGAHLAEGADPEWNWNFMPELLERGTITGE